MRSTTQERIKALEVALNNESQERAFYLKHAGRTKNAFGKGMFEAIANDEVEHYERIKELHRALSEKGKWPETVPLTVKGTIVKALLGKLIKSVDSSAKADTDDKEAVQIAIEFEARGERFYADLRDSSPGPMERDFFALIAAMEREHRLSLEDTRDYFQDPAGWFRIKERLHVDGG
jgi:rubrerythrin